MKFPLVLVATVSLAHMVSAEILSIDLKHCPDGHVTLKDVPISWGLPAAATDSEWKELQRHLDNLDFVLGGV